MADYSDANVNVAVVVLKAIYRSQGQEPLGVQLCSSREDQQYVWRREAKKYLLEVERRRHFGIRPMTVKEVIHLQDVDPEWEELAGEAPGEDEKLRKEARK